ncbi:MAG: DUF6046 domain-containing protein, partial [Mucinivorans sp.]
MNRPNYDNMSHRFDPLALLVKALALKGLYYPGIWIPTLDKTGKIHTEESYNRMPQANTPRMRTLTGTEIRKTNAQGRVYFMPVELDTSLGKIELPAAAISIKGKKTIVETALTGRRGSVKELISVDDYEINLHGVIVSGDANYPEEMVQQFRDVFELNESIKLICALSDLVLQPDDRIVIKTIDWPEV